MRKQCCRKQDWEGKLRECGYRVTQGRQAVLDAMQSAKAKHLSAEDIFLALKETNPGIGLTSVYRTLDLLVETGYVFKHAFGDGRARYELSHGDEEVRHHHHAVCVKCRKVIDLSEFIDAEQDLLRNAESELLKKHRFTTLSHTVQHFGVCADCR